MMIALRRVARRGLKASALRLGGGHGGHVQPPPPAFARTKLPDGPLEEDHDLVSVQGLAHSIVHAAARRYSTTVSLPKRCSTLTRQTSTSTPA